MVVAIGVQVTNAENVAALSSDVVTLECVTPVATINWERYSPWPTREVLVRDGQVSMTV